MAELTKEIENDPRPDDIPATEILMLHDEAADSSLVVLFFDNEDDYAKGDAALNAMDTERHPRQQDVGDEVHGRRPHDGLTSTRGTPAPAGVPRLPPGGSARFAASRPRERPRV